MVLYGIANCDTVKKARAWLADRSIDYRFHDYKKSVISGERLASWVDALGWESLLNRAGTTFRKLPEAERSGIDPDRAMALMLAQPSMIKRPVVEYAGGLLVSFNPERWAGAFGA